MGDTIMVRSFAQVPRLEEVTFLRGENRAFVTGQGPYPLTISLWFVRFFLVAAAVFAVFGLGLIAVAQMPMLFLGRPLRPSEDWIGLLGIPALALAAVDVGISFFFRRMWERETHMAAEGGLLPGELLSARVRASKNGNYLQVECRFTSPEGKLITAKKSVGRPDRRLKTAPPPGTKVLILYDSDRLWQVL